MATLEEVRARLNKSSPAEATTLNNIKTRLRASRSAQSSAPGGGGQDLAAAVKQKFKAIAPYDLQVIDSRNKGISEGRKLEFYPPSESNNPAPGRPTVEVFDPSFKGDELTNIIAADFLHHLGKTDPTLVDLREQFRASMTPEQQVVDRRAYERARAGEFGRPETRPYDEWFDVHRLDQYLGGTFLPSPNEWEGAYTPKQKQILGRIKRYLETGPPPTPPRKPADLGGYAPIPATSLPTVTEPRGLTRSALNAIVQGAAGGVAGFPEAVGVEQQRTRRSRLEMFDRIDRGEPLPKSFQARAPRGDPVMAYFRATPEQRQMLRADLEAEVRPIGEEPAYKLGQDIRGATSRAAPIDPEHAGSFPVQLGQGIGSTAAFLASGVIGRAVRLPALLTAAGTGAVVNSAQTFQDAMAHGASFEEALKASRLSGLVGTSEAVPISRLLDRFDKASGGQVRRIMTNALKGGAEEGVQEVFQSVMENLIAQGIYDPKRGTFSGTAEGGQVGFTVGALFNVIAGMMGARMRGSPEQVTKEFTEHIVRESEGLSAPSGRPAVRGPAFEPTPRTPEAPATTEPAPGAEIRPDEGIPETAIPKARPIGRRVETESGAFDISFPDDLHARLFDLATTPDREEARRLAAGLKGFIGERFDSPSDVISLAREYREEVLDQAAGGARAGRAQPEPAPMVVDPDRQSEYLLNLIHGKLGTPKPAAPTVVPEPIATEPVQPEAPLSPEAEAERTAEIRRKAFEARKKQEAKAVDSQRAAAAAAQMTTYVQPEFTPKATVVQIGNLGQGIFEGGGYVSNGQFIIESEVDPKLAAQVRKRGADAFPRDPSVTMAEAEKNAVQPFEPVAAYDPKLNPDSPKTARPYVFTQAGDVWAGMDAGYYDYLTRQGLSIMWSPKAPEGAYALVKDGRVVGAVQPISMGTAQLMEVKAAVKRFGLEPGPQGTTKQPKYKPALGVPRSEAALDTALKRLQKKRREARIPAPTREKAKGLRKATIQRLKALEAEALARERIWQEALKRADKLEKAESQKIEISGRNQFSMGFTDGLHGRTSRPPDYQSPDLENLKAAYSEGYKLGKQHAKTMPADPESVTVDIELPSATGGGAKLTVTATTDVLGDIRGEIERQGEGKFYAQTGAGKNYVGMVPDTTEGTKPDKPLRREDILRPLLKALNIRLYQGRIKSKRFLGFYRRPIQEVRIKRMNDIEVAAHELAHMLDDRIPEIRRQWFPATKANKDIREELRGVSYDQSKLFEGFAEFVRLWATQKEKAQKAAPKFYAWFEDFVSRFEHGAALRKAQEDMHRWFAQDALSRARSKIGAAEDINSGLTSIFRRFRQSVADDLDAVMSMEKELTGGLDPVGAYETARLVRAKASITEGALIYGAPVVNKDGSHSFKGKGLQQILDPVSETLDDFLAYAVGRSAKELRGQGRERLFSRAEVDAMVALETPAFKTAFEEYQVWNRAILDFAEAKGAIDPEARAKWKRNQYIPFYRVGMTGPSKGGRIPGDWRGIRRLTGGTANIRDVLGNMIGNAAMLIDAGLTNEARLKIAKLARKPGGAKFMARIAKESTMVRAFKNDVKRAVADSIDRNLAAEERAAIKKGDEDPTDIAERINHKAEWAGDTLDEVMDMADSVMSIMIRNQAPRGRNIAAVLVRGKPVYYEVADPQLFKSLQNLQRPARGWLMNLVAIPKRIGQASITLSLDFMAANIARDTLSGFVFSRHGFKPAVDSARGMASRLRADENYKDFIANGGGFASYLVDEGAYRKHLERFYLSRGIDFKTVLSAPSEILLGLERIADSFEMSTRLGEFRRAKARGEHPRHAAYSAREVSTDFAMRGDSALLGFMYDTVIFLKAAVNGMDRLYRGLAHDPNRAAIAGKTALLAAISMALYGLNRDNPLYDDLEDWDKDTHWHFFIPKPATIEAQANGKPLPPLKKRYWHFRYPKIWEIGAISSLAERSLGRMLDNEPEELGEDFLRILYNTFEVEWVPQAVAPLYEQAINRNRFTDRPIENFTQQQLLPWARVGPGTSQTMRALGEATRKLPRGAQLSPSRSEALLRGYLNTWAMYGLTLSDAVFFDDAPDLRIDQYPVLRRFYQTTPSKNVRQVTEFYDALKEATEVRKTMRAMAKAGRPDIVAEMEHSAENLRFNRLSRAGKTMSGISKEMRRIGDISTLKDLHEYANDRAEGRIGPHIGKLRLSKSWNSIGALKRELLDLWIEERNDLAKRVMETP